MPFLPHACVPDENLDCIDCGEGRDAEHHIPDDADDAPEGVIVAETDAGDDVVRRLFVAARAEAR